MKEVEAEKIYNTKVNEIQKQMKKKDTTYLGELNRVGKKMFGIKFKGVFASDKIPPLNDLAPYCILNLDKSDEPGSHWISVAKSPKGDYSYCYDSFGRRNTDIIPTLKKSGNGRIIDTDYDANQKVKELNCGQKSLGWLYMFDKYGEDIAKLI